MWGWLIRLVIREWCFWVDDTECLCQVPRRRSSRSARALFGSSLKAPWRTRAASQHCAHAGILLKRSERPPLTAFVGLSSLNGQQLMSTCSESSDSLRLSMIPSCRLSWPLSESSELKADSPDHGKGLFRCRSEPEFQQVFCLLVALDQMLKCARLLQF